MKIKTSDLTGVALDWATAKCEGVLRPIGDVLLLDGRLCEVLCGTHEVSDVWHKYSPSTNWSQGGPIIEREKLELRPGLYHSELWACWGQTQHGERNSQQGKTGPTPLIAAMRCYVASKLGEEVDVPEEL